MSADNCVAILHTRERFQATAFENGKPYAWRNLFDNPVDTWRVAHTQAIENFDWYRDNQLYMLGHYMISVWGKSEIFYNLEDARAYARRLCDSIDFVEYGIVEVDARDFDLSNF